MEYHIVGEDYGKCVELWVGKVIVHSKFSGLFHGNSEDKKAESSADHGSLNCEVIKDILRISQRIC